MIVSQIRKNLGCSQEYFAGLAGVTAKTIARWEHKITCPNVLAQERMGQLESVSLQLIEVFSPQNATKWLRTPNQALGGRMPIDELSRGHEGIESVSRLLGAIEWGLFT